MTYLICIAIIFWVIAHSSVKVVRTSQVYLVERFGKYHNTLQPGIRVIVPFIDRIAHVVDMRSQVVDTPSQPAITQDNITVKVDFAVYYRITDPGKAIYQVGNLHASINNEAITIIRDIIGKMNLADTLSSKDPISFKLMEYLREHADQYGYKIDRSEIKSITPPPNIKTCSLCGIDKDPISFKGKNICATCIEEIKNL